MTTRDKIYIENDEHILKIYESLTDEHGDTPTKPFRYDRDVFMAAAVLGCKNNMFREITKRKEKFLWGTLLNDEDALPVLHAIALYKTKDPNILLDDDKIAAIAEGYANEGIKLLAKSVLDTGIDELQEAALYLSELPLS